MILSVLVCDSCDFVNECPTEQELINKDCPFCKEGNLIEYKTEVGHDIFEKARIKMNVKQNFGCYEED